MFKISVRLGNAFCSVRHCSHVLSVGPTELLQTNEEKCRPTAQCEPYFAFKKYFTTMFLAISF